MSTMKARSLPRLLQLCHPAFVRLFLRMWRLFRGDSRCSMAKPRQT
jgi:hypothetical protein